MIEFKEQGAKIREASKLLVLDYLQHNSSASPTGPGIKQSEICRECGLDWGDYPKATSTNQQYWTVALLKELEVAGRVQQVHASGPWRLRV